MIVIKTKLDDGIYASCGGGRVKTHYTWKTAGPRNLLAACRKLKSHIRQMIISFGNMGCGSSWIEINGIVMDRHVVDDIIIANDIRQCSKFEERRHLKTSLQEAAAYLQVILDARPGVADHSGPRIVELAE